MLTLASNSDKSVQLETPTFAGQPDSGLLMEFVKFSTDVIENQSIIRQVHRFSVESRGGAVV